MFASYLFSLKQMEMFLSSEYFLLVTKRLIVWETCIGIGFKNIPIAESVLNGMNHETKACYIPLHLLHNRDP